MKHSFLRIILLTITLSSAICRAEQLPVTHNFASMSSNSKIIYTGGNTVGTTDLLTYTCSDGASFGSQCCGAGAAICINFPHKNDNVTLSPCDSLAGIAIEYYAEISAIDNFEIRLSKDGTNWSAPLETTYHSGHTEVSFVPGRYYVRIRNKSSQKNAIPIMTYTFGACNCNIYLPE